jgi:hypothetical protein
MTSPDAIKAELILLTNDESLAGKLFAKMRTERMVDNTTNIRNIQCMLDGKEPERQHALSTEIDWHANGTLSAKLDSIAEAAMPSNSAKALQVGSDTSTMPSSHMYFVVSMRTQEANPNTATVEKSELVQMLRFVLRRKVLRRYTIYEVRGLQV